MKPWSRTTRQGGATLFISLVMLLILTVLGVSSVQNTGMQEVMSRNTLDSALAFQGAESAVTESEQYVESLNNVTPFQTANVLGRYDTVANGPVDLTTFDWVTAGNNSRGFATVSTTIAGVASQPRFIIEYVAAVQTETGGISLGGIGEGVPTVTTFVFRVTTYGSGGTDAARVMLQTTYGKRF